MKIKFAEVDAEKTEIRVLRNENLEGTLKLIDDSWVFFPDDDQIDPIDYKNNNLEEVKEEIKLAYEALD
ncbi:hypothetical protein FC89_GL002139 [Liquorilactobacillus ghanensis DSM 18630]|jgi:hypothetical protein|uniref:Uncharacterized protein n=1 Tax=Liquorilactobacillus ghanensis DSM 18630 TaxID=1423750 RepID=A0A0R1VKW9_9LACO|nr:hypothetical protein [Liquorilactobacillus ghanensis]KRM04459.1 hypothetical protein FC89_GL002139 [Liquorilactobacillus ghanensis DSM 18630]